MRPIIPPEDAVFSLKLADLRFPLLDFGQFARCKSHFRKLRQRRDVLRFGFDRLDQMLPHQIVLAFIPVQSDQFLTDGGTGLLGQCIDRRSQDLPHSSGFFREIQNLALNKHALAS